MPKIINIELLSAASLYIELFFNDTLLAKATSFVAKRNNKYFLLTNRHNVTGRNQNTGELLDKTTAAFPNKMQVYFNLNGKVGGNICVDYPLLNDGELAWYEHPNLKDSADMVAFKVDTNNNLIDVSPSYDLDSCGIDIALKPGTRLNIIGFPFGKRTMNNFGVWITGFLASDFDIDIEGKPQFYIDARTRTGQSGSPVVFYRQGENVKMKNEHTAIAWSGHQLLGIYSGRISDDSDIGVVWKKEAICELLDSIPSSP
ncbi:TPA: trypsin-like serine peptidase [Legionella pneumophila]